MADFQEVKAAVSIESVAAYLEIDLKRSGDSLRGCCPLCGGDNPRAFVVTLSKGLYYAFCCQKGGDQIQLYADLRQISTKQAGDELAEIFLGAQEPAALEPLDYLEAEHPAVLALGFPAEIAQSLGVGFAPKGTMRGRVLMPLRSPEGRLLGYAGYSPTLDPPLKLPGKWRM